MKSTTNKYILFCCVILTLFFKVDGLAAKPRPKPIVYVGEDGKLVYLSDSLGNRVIDFSYCGYEASNKDIPLVDAKVFIPAMTGDATDFIQRSIDYVASLPADENGFRGAIQFDKGEFHVNGRIVIRHSGIVLRGMGMANDGTKLIAEGKDRNTFISVLGKDNRQTGQTDEITSDYVPVNANWITTNNTNNYKVGQAILIHRLATKKWSEKLGMVEMGGEETGYLGWKEGQRDINWERTVQSIKGDTLFFDVPLTMALDTTYGKSHLMALDWNGRISNIGIENISLSSAYDSLNMKDEDHCYTAVTIENAENVWVRQVVFTHFAGSAVAVYETGRKVTVQDCVSLEPVSEIGGWRRNTFFTMGQQTLFQRLYAEEGYHDYATGFCAAGPNAFVECHSNQPYSYNGPIDSWSTGLLFDIVNVDGQMISFNNHYGDNQGSGWCAANCMIWQCSAPRIENFAPPTATNWCFGSWGQFVGDGYWHEQNSHISPRSLFYKQLADRLGKDESVFKDRIRKAPHEATSSPTPESAKELSMQAFNPLESHEDWVMRASERDPINTKKNKVELANKLKYTKTKEEEASTTVKIENGWIVSNAKVLTGMRITEPWWRGVARPYEVPKASTAITRFVPGRYGHGYTDNLKEVVAAMKENNLAGIEHNYGLWYDRRRDDHERIRRMNGNVWAPFYVQPFARSGQGTAWDGLSKYDLTKYDNFYWSRLKEFADLAEKEGRILVHHNYFQHNILEAGAHWADSPWRPANNINKTGFPDPPPYAGDKRIFMAEQFYDENNEVRRPLHEAFIRKCMSNFEDNSNVLQLISAEYTGPLHFTEFWLDVIKKWEKETGKHQMIGLSTTKDVQDAILNEPVRAATVDVIDIRYWSYRPDGSAYAPGGGENLAPRQHARIEKTGSRSFNSTYQSVIEYKKRFPEKAVIFTEGRFDQYGWAVFMAGGSLPVLPQGVSNEMMKAAISMKPVGNTEDPVSLCMLSNDNGEYIIHLKSKNKVELDYTKLKGKYELKYVDLNTGEIKEQQKYLKGGSTLTVENPWEENCIIWIQKK